MRNFREEVNNLNKEIAELRKVYQSKASVAITEATKEFFEETPEVVKIFWNQWVPGFNDGEACEFTRGDIQIVLASDEDNDDGEEGSSIYTLDDLKNYEKYAARNDSSSDYW